MNKDLNLVNNEENTIVEQKNYPSAIGELRNICSLDSNNSCGDSLSAVKKRQINN